MVSTVASRKGGPVFESTIWAFLCGVWAVGGATQTQRGGVRGVRLTGDFKLVVQSFQGVPHLSCKPDLEKWKKMDVLFTDGGEPAGANM